MRRYLTIPALIALVLVAGADVSIARMPRGGSTASSAPSAPTNILVTQGGSSCTNSFENVGCSQNEQDLAWTASSGATYYVVLRNGSTPSTGGCSSTVAGTSCNDATATNSNLVGGTSAVFGDETTYQYQVEACNGGGCSSPAYAATYIYNNGAQNSAQNFSGGGFGAYMTTQPVANFTSGQQLFTITSVGSYTIYPQAGIDDDAGHTGGANVVPGSASTGGPGFPYILPYGSTCNGTTTTGNGGTGNYCLSVAATGTATGDIIQQSPGGYYQGRESMPTTTNPEPGHTYAMHMWWIGAANQGYIQEFIARPEAPEYDLNVGAFNYMVFDINLSNLTNTQEFGIHSRPGANGPNTGDVYSTRVINLVAGSSSSYCGTLTANTWIFNCKVPLADLGIGTGTFSGYVANNYQCYTGCTGGSYNGSNALTLPTGGTTSGSSANIAAGDYITINVSGGSGGWFCVEATGPVSGGVVPTAQCPIGNNPPSGTVTNLYDVQVCAASASAQPGPDNAGLLQGNSEPDATYFMAQSAGISHANNTGVGTCLNGAAWGAGNSYPGHWAVFNGNGLAITSQGTAGSPLTFTSKRTSLYKPEWYGNGTTTTADMYLDKWGFTVN